MTTAIFLWPSFLRLDETPSKTVQAFVEAFNAQDSAGLIRRVAGTKAGKFDMDPPIPKIKATIGKTQEMGDQATVEVKVEFGPPEEPRRLDKNHETVHLRKIDGDWRIEGIDARGIKGDVPYISAIAYIVEHPDVFIKSQREAKEALCAMQVTVLAQATIRYALDHEGRLPKTSAGWKKALRPYVNDERAFHCPDDPSGNDSYFLDPRLAGRKYAQIAKPGQTAMIVEGSDGRAAFRHRGRAAVGFVEGDAKLLIGTQILKARQILLK